MSGHNHINGLIEKVKDTIVEKMTYEQDPKRKFVYFMEDQILPNLPKNGSKICGNRHKCV